MPKNMLSEGQNSFWYSQGQYVQPSGLYAPYDENGRRELANLAFTAGARWSTRQTSALSPYIAKLIEMLLLLGFFETDPEMPELPELDVEVEK